MYEQTFSIYLQNGGSKTVTMMFDDYKQAELYEIDNYDKCRDKVQEWLTKHYAEKLNDDGEDIEASGAPADNDDILDFRSCH